MLTTKKWGAALATVFMVTAMATAASAGSRNESRSESDAEFTKSYMVDIYTGFDVQGRIIEGQNTLTSTESFMLDQVDRHCAAKTREIEGYFMENVKNGTRFGLIGGLASAVGAVLGFPGSSFLGYLKYAGISMAGSGVASTQLIWEQNKKIVHGYCVLQWVSANKQDLNDKRLARILIYPMIAGKAKRPASSSEVTERADAHDNDPAETDEKSVSDTTPPPIMPPPL